MTVSRVFKIVGGVALSIAVVVAIVLAVVLTDDDEENLSAAEILTHVPLIDG